MRRLLEYQAERIEMVLASHKVPSQVCGGTVTPRFVRFELVPRIGTKVSRIKGLGEEIALSLGIPSCRVFRQNGKINVEIPRQTPRTVKLLTLCRRLAEIPPCTAVLGLDEEGTPLLLRLPSADVAHVLVAGRTGSGKTEVARTMIASLAMYNRLGEVQLVLIDPKGRGFAPFATLPHLLYPLVEDVEGTSEVLGRLVVEMERRDHEKVTQPQVVVFIDELADLMMVGGKEMEHLLTRLLQRGRGAGIHVVACVQKPTVAVIGSLVKSNFPVRIVGSVVSPEDAKVASGLAGTGAERLLGRGDFLVVAQGQVMRLQAAYVSSQEIRELTARLREGGRKSRRCVVSLSNQWVEEATGTDGMAVPLRRLAARLRLVK
jgi:S-DNA-T family DNA segregation ATPase FtsK/SpoIIIE